MLRFNRSLFILVTILIGVCVLPLGLSAQDDMGEAHKETIRRIIDEAFSQGDLAVVDEHISPDYVRNDYSGTEVDREAFKGIISAWRDAMPDYEASVDQMVAGGDWVAFRFMSTGTFENELAFFPGLPPNGETIVVLAHVFLRFNEDGQVVEEWSLVSIRKRFES